METKIYGHSDDTIEVEGGVEGETVGVMNTLLTCSDGTVATISYDAEGFWKVNVLRSGLLVSRLVHHDDCNNDPECYTDVLYFHAGLKWVFASSIFESVS